MSNSKIYAENPPDSITIPLKHKIHFGETVIEELVVRPMNAGHQRRIKTEGNLPLPMMSELAALLTGQPQQVIDQVTGIDLGRLNAAVQGFFTSSQQIGDSPAD